MAPVSGVRQGGGSRREGFHDTVAAPRNGDNGPNHRGFGDGFVLVAAVKKH